MIRTTVIWLMGVALLAAGCRQLGWRGTDGARPAAAPELENLLEVADGVYSGGEPANAAAFAQLRELGVRTVVSVDGARPKVALAKQYGMQYVHVPIGYDGVPDAAGLALTRVMREAQRPIYFHCHHGRHRGPAAVAIACIGAGMMGATAGREVLERAGTSTGYAGLWRDVAAFRPPPPGATLPELVEAAEVESLVAAMAAADRAYDNLKLCMAADWQAPAAHPDLDPAQQALLLWEGMRESNRHTPTDSDARYRDWMAAAEQSALALRRALETRQHDAADELFEAIRDSCRQCHKAYRN